MRGGRGYTSIIHISIMSSEQSRACDTLDHPDPVVWIICTVEPVLQHDVRQETFDAVREVYGVRLGILILALL